MATLMQCLRDITDLTYQRYRVMTAPFYLTGSTEMISENLKELSTQERWERGEMHGDGPTEQAYGLDVEEQMAIRDLQHAHDMFRFTNGPIRQTFRVQVSDLIQQIRALRFERAQLGGMQ